jgi:hypothetical protein
VESYKFPSVIFHSINRDKFIFHVFSTSTCCILKANVKFCLCTQEVQGWGGGRAPLTLKLSSSCSCETCCRIPHFQPITDSTYRLLNCKSTKPTPHAHCSVQEHLDMTVIVEWPADNPPPEHPRNSYQSCNVISVQGICVTFR